MGSGTTGVESWRRPRRGVHSERLIHPPDPKNGDDGWVGDGSPGGSRRERENSERGRTPARTRPARLNSMETIKFGEIRFLEVWGNENEMERKRKDDIRKEMQGKRGCKCTLVQVYAHWWTDRFIEKANGEGEIYK